MSLRYPVALLIVLLATACGDEGPVDPREIAVAHVGDVPVSLAELEFYFSLNLLTEEGEGVAVGEDFDRVKSRLLDSLIDERTLLAEAERRGLAVAEAEIDSYLRSPIDAEPISEDWLTSSRYRAMARRRLMIRKLEADEAAGLPAASEEEIRAYAERHGERLSPRRRLRVRSLRLDSMETAERVDRQIREGRTNFAQAVVTHETGPGQGIPLELHRDTLPEPFRAVLDEMEPGEVTPPLEFHGDIYLFQLVGWLSPPEDDARVRNERAREELEREGRREANDALFRRLRERTPVEIHPGRLPFRYVPEDLP